MKPKPLKQKGEIMGLKENREITRYRQMMEAKYKKDNTPESLQAFLKAKDIEEQVWIKYNNDRMKTT